MALPPLGIGVHVSQLYWRVFEPFIATLPWEQGMMILLFQEKKDLHMLDQLTVKAKITDSYSNISFKLLRWVLELTSN